MITLDLLKEQTLKVRKGKLKGQDVTIKDWHSSLNSKPYYRTYGELLGDYLSRISTQNIGIDDNVIVCEKDGKETWVHEDELELMRCKCGKTIQKQDICPLCGHNFKQKKEEKKEEEKIIVDGMLIPQNVDSNSNVLEKVL